MAPSHRAAYTASGFMSTQIIQQQKETVDKVVAVIQENNKLKTLVANMYTEAKTKIEQSNAQINLGNQKIMETTKDATDFAQYIAQNMGGNQNVMP